MFDMYFTHIHHCYFEVQLSIYAFMSVFIDQCNV